MEFVLFIFMHLHLINIIHYSFPKISIFATGFLRIVTFSDCGQPIGANSTILFSYIGQVARTNVPPNYAGWKKVPEALMERVWHAISVSAL